MSCKVTGHKCWKAYDEVHRSNELEAWYAKMQIYKGSSDCKCMWVFIHVGKRFHMKMGVCIGWCFQLPNILDYFGWCTWDAFYTDVSAEGVKLGLKRYRVWFLTLLFTCIMVLIRCMMMATRNQNLFSDSRNLFCSLSEGGIPARFLIIDDGWQSVAADTTLDSAETVAVTEGTQ